MQVEQQSVDGEEDLVQATDQIRSDLGWEEDLGFKVLQSERGSNLQ